VLSFFWRLANVLSGPTDWLHIYWRTDTRLDSLFFGVLLTCIVALPKSSRLRTFVCSTQGLLLGLGLLAASFIYRGEVFRMTGRYSLQGAALMFAIAFVVFNETSVAQRIRGVLRNALILYVAKISYALYLWHLTIVKFAQHVFPAGGPWLAISCAFLSVAFADLSYRLVEAPFLALRHHFGSRSAT
jgi:peptidoglycan/LPS O-acetylase OafA/YrhL